MKWIFLFLLNLVVMGTAGAYTINVVNSDEDWGKPQEPCQGYALSSDGLFQILVKSEKKSSPDPMVKRSILDKKKNALLKGEFFLISDLKPQVVKMAKVNWGSGLAQGVSITLGKKNYIIKSSLSKDKGRKNVTLTLKNKNKGKFQNLYTCVTGGA